MDICVVKILLNAPLHFNKVFSNINIIMDIKHFNIE